MPDGVADRAGGRRAAAGHDRALPRARHLPGRRPATSWSCTRRPAASGCCSRRSCKLRGGRVIATTSTEEKAELARGAGADEMIGYDGFVERVAELTAARASPRSTTASARRRSRTAWTRCARRASWSSTAWRAAGPTARPADARRRRVALPQRPGSRTYTLHARAPARARGRACSAGRRRRARRADRRALSARRTRAARTRTSRRAGRPESCCSFRKRSIEP